MGWNFLKSQWKSWSFQQNLNFIGYSLDLNSWKGNELKFLPIIAATIVLPTTFKQMRWLIRFEISTNKL